MQPKMQSLMHAHFFGRNLNHPDAHGAFQYFKCGQTHILSKDDAIAKKWKELLVSDPVISLRFAHMQSELLLSTFFFFFFVSMFIVRWGVALW
jgi:hypothetical protein